MWHCVIDRHDLLIHRLIWTWKILEYKLIDIEVDWFVVEVKGSYFMCSYLSD